MSHIETSPYLPPKFSTDFSHSVNLELDETLGKAGEVQMLGRPAYRFYVERATSSGSEMKAVIKKSEKAGES